MRTEDEQQKEVSRMGREEEEEKQLNSEWRNEESIIPIEPVTNNSNEKEEKQSRSMGVMIKKQY